MQRLVRVYCFSVSIPNTVLSVSINIYLVPIINWAWTIICSGLWHLRCHLVSGKLGVSYTSKSSTAFIHPGCSSRCSLPATQPSWSLTANVTTNFSQSPSCLDFHQWGVCSYQEGLLPQATGILLSPSPLSTYPNILEVWKFWGNEK